MATKRQKTITDLMNGICRDRQFKPLEISVIDSCIRPEWQDRKKKGIIVRGKTDEGKMFIYQRIADIVNDVLKPKSLIKAEHIRIYKKCRTDEYTDRTGKCAWGFKELLVKQGYDPVTRYEISC